MPLLTIRRVDTILGLIRANLPTNVETDGDFEDWNVIAPAMLSIVADLFEGMMVCTPPRGRLRADVLARSLSEHAIAFAWLASSEEARPGRIRSLLLDEFQERSRASNIMEKEIAGRQAYRDLFDETKRFGGAVPKTVLDEPTRNRLKELEADESIKPLPNAFDMAYAADTYWMPKLALVNRNPYALIYYMLFSASSFSTHPSISAVARMTSGSGAGQVTVGAPEGLGESDAPYGPAYLALVNTLTVASTALGWPKPGPILALLLDGG
ncbi:MAG TPA: DUF5677 domain-containing protein [Solirubrobacterales bacterium]|jgi:hypothetical protein|nr:DUF5677 domain-containing protein [Solirubrobacterales bacterium]